MIFQALCHKVNYFIIDEIFIDDNEPAINTFQKHRMNTMAVMLNKKFTMFNKVDKAPQGKITPMGNSASEANISK